MAVEGKTILQTPERTELTGKEGIPFQEGERNGHVLLERINEYVSGNVVYILPGALETTKDWSTTDVESIVGNWDEFVEAVNHKVVIAKVSIGYDGIIAYIPAGIVKLDGFIGFYINAGNGIFVYSISSDRISLETLVVVPNVINNLNSDNEESALSAAQGKVLNDKIAEISNPASADKDGLMSKEDKKTFDSIRFSENENSIWFNGKKYGATLFKNLFGLSTGSSNEEIKTALGGNTYNDISKMVDRGILFLNINNKALQHVMIRIENTGSSEGDYLHIRGLSDASDTAYIKIRHYNGTFSIPSAVKRDNLLFKSGIVNVLDSSASDLPLSAAMGKQLNNGKISRSEIVNDLDSNNSGKPLSAAMGKELNDKIEAIKSEISALRDEIEALKGSGA
jgi:hypothetical protein